MQSEAARGLMPQAEMQGGKAAHRQTDDMRLLLADRIEHGEDIVGGARLRIGRDLLGHVRRRKAARVEGNRAIALAEMPQLRLETPDVAGELVDEDHGTAAAGLLEIQAYAVICRRMRHQACPLLLP